MDLVPGSNTVSRFNHPEPEKTGSLQDSLRDALADVRSNYDAVLCDTPPSLETLSWLPAVAADVVLTPTPAESLAVQELVHTGRFLERVRWSRNPRLVWLGVALWRSSSPAWPFTRRSPGRSAKRTATSCWTTPSPTTCRSRNHHRAEAARVLEAEDGGGQGGGRGRGSSSTGSRDSRGASQEAA